MTTTPSVNLEFDTIQSMARQSVYRYVALALLDPRAGSWSQLAEANSQRLVKDAAALLRADPLAKASRLAHGERPLEQLDPTSIFARLPTDSKTLNNTFEATFGLLASCACPPCETEYIDSKYSFQRSGTLADVGGFYHAFGVKRAHDHPERPDHIVLELEFMAFLIDLERRAAESDDPDKEERMTVCREAQAKFLGEHLAWWVPAFCRLLARECPDGFYAAVADFLSAWIAADRAILNVDPPQVMVQPSPSDRPEPCDGCSL